jgi:hypothetical protein
MGSLDRIDNDLTKYEFLMSLLASNARVFFKAMIMHTERLMPSK